MTRSRSMLRLAMVPLVLSLWVGRNAAGQDAGAAVEGPPEAEAVELSTSDGIAITAWYYAPWNGSEEDPPKAATPVIIVHDLLGSHESVEPLALALQRKGMAVISPDLRGHGESRGRSNAAGQAAAGQKNSIEAGQLRKADLESIAAVAGGTVREQAAVQGDLEVVRAWLAGRAGDGSIDMKRLCVVASGLGATIAAQWVANDWAWGERPLASGPQGGFIRGLVLVSPVWANKGVSLTPVLASPAFRGEIPLLLIAGTGDRDTTRLFDQLKRFQPDSWFEQKSGQEPKWSPQLAKSADASLFSIQLAAQVSGDRLVSDPSASPAERIAGFINLVTSRRGK